jgi:hypothetical protein
LSAVEDGLSSLQRLLPEVHREIELALHDEPSVAHADEVAALRREVEQLREGLASRAVIERAKGILMHSRSLPESQAFDLLNEMSQRAHRKLRDIAAEIVEACTSAAHTTQPVGVLPPKELDDERRPGAEGADRRPA